MRISVSDIIRRAVEEHCADGLINDEFMCCCSSDDLFPCECVSSSCELARRSTDERGISVFSQIEVDDG